MYQSYVGGLYVDQGLPAVQGWLHPLLSPYIVEAHALVRKQHGVRDPAPPPRVSFSSSATPSSRRLSIGMVHAPNDFKSEQSHSTATDIHRVKEDASKQVKSGAADQLSSPTMPSPPGDVSTHDTPLGYLQLFNQYAAQQKKAVEWTFDKSTGSSLAPGGNRAKPVSVDILEDGEGSEATPVWVVRALVGPRCIGRGKGRTKKAAKNEAAREALKALGVVI
jgi:ribonuclease-3